jgi:hypothetical protein
MNVAVICRMPNQSPRASAAPLEFMMADHELLESHLAHIIALLESNDRAAMPAPWTEFDARTRAHLHAEEQWLLPALLRWRQRDARVIVEEHKLIRRRLDELGIGIGNQEVQVYDLCRFLDELRAHSRIEEEGVYRWAEEHLNQSAKDELFANIPQPSTKS